MSKVKKPFYKKKKIIVPFVIILILIAGRVYLPYYIRDKLNETLADIPGYYGQVDDVGISLWRGAYQLNGLFLDKVDPANKRSPFLNFPTSDISIQWRALLDGRIVSEITMVSPEVTYVFEDHVAADGSLDEPSTEVWTKALTEIVPLEINRYEVVDGKLTFVALYSEPNIDLYMNNVNLLATNLQNTIQSERILPSDFEATATTIGNGRFETNGKINLIKEIPDMNLEMSLEDADITALNDLTLHYAGIDFESGTFELFSEIAIADSYMKGYFKPFFIDSKIVDSWDKEDSNIFKKMWEGFVGMFKFLLKNQGNDTLATKIPIEGPLDDAAASAWASVFNIFENGWFGAFNNSVDGTIDFRDAELGADQVDDRNRRKYDRAKRREERKINRVELRADLRNNNEDKSDDINVKKQIKEIKKETKSDVEEMKNNSENSQ
ncbi:DUF748 domain-containing protein [Nonlabens antarcticus]|uniref:DUF748 domain-containing protein n=1 Tax=Nonlabens antarcticus TaxID=392714 RepID=UPI001891F1FF|nr:DUF748 domain-containing protein [Nonlabens antarcticus]